MKYKVGDKVRPGPSSLVRKSTIGLIVEVDEFFVEVFWDCHVSSMTYSKPYDRWLIPYNKQLELFNKQGKGIIACLAINR